MSILYNEQQQAIASEAARVLAAQHDKARLLALLEQTGDYDRGFWQTSIKQGWTALPLAEEHGGLGLGLIEMGIIAQACGSQTVGAPFLTGNYGAAIALARAGTSPWLAKLAAGEAVAAIAFAESNEPLPAAPSVQFRNGKLSGTKHGVVGGLQADFALVLADQGLVLAELTGVERRAINSFDNSRGHADLIFTDCPATLVAEGGAARALALDMLARMAVVTAHEQLGGAEALMFAARDYALARKAFGQPIGAFQSVKHRIAEFYALVELARANCIHAASREGQSDFLRAAASARLSATEAYDTAARDCVQIHGGIGVTWEHGLHLHMRRARSLAGEQGNMFFWEDVLTTDLTGEAA